MSIAFTSYAAAYPSTSKAIRAAVSAGYRIDKAADPTEGAREDLSADEAIDVAGQDASLLSIEVVYSDELAESWLADAGAEQDPGTVEVARRALAGDVDAQADVVAWEIDSIARKIDNAE